MSTNPPELQPLGHIPEKTLKRKDLNPISKLVIYYLSKESNIDDDGGIKTTIEKIADGIGEEERNIKNIVKELKIKGIISVKAGRYPRFYFAESMVLYKVPLNRSIVPQVVPLKNLDLNVPINRNEDRVNRATPDFSIIKKRHKNLNPAIALIPKSFRAEVPKEVINWWLFKRNQGLAYIKYLGRISSADGVKKPIKYFMQGVWKYYSDFLTSPEYQEAGVKLAISEFKERH